ncbi:MAG TPA: hypothetical protein VE871_21155 [Longimicrobium sp.]|nr:hypothetical protein [Longimicrobium sp.]
MTALGRMALLAAIPALAAAPAAAQDDGCASLLPAGAAADSARPTVLLRATATIRELRFETQPRTEVRTTGCAGLDSIVVTERVNLPDPVEPGVTYRDVRVGIEIRANLDVACLPALAADPSFASLCGSASAAPASPSQQQPSQQQPSQQQPNAPAPANFPRR